MFVLLWHYHDYGSDAVYLSWNFIYMLLQMEVFTAVFNSCHPAHFHAQPHLRINFHSEFLSQICYSFQSTKSTVTVGKKEQTALQISSFPGQINTIPDTQPCTHSLTYTSDNHGKHLWLNRSSILKKIAVYSTHSNIRISNAHLKTSKDWKSQQRTQRPSQHNHYHGITMPHWVYKNIHSY